MSEANTTVESGPLPAPRLQLRWEKPTDELRAAFVAFPPDWVCHYELVIPLQEYDLRGEVYGDDEEVIDRKRELVVSIKQPMGRGGDREPCKAEWSPTGFYDDTPFRDGAHAHWDSEALGGLPIFVIAATGEALRVHRSAGR